MRLVAASCEGWGFTLCEDSAWGLEAVASVPPRRAHPFRRAVLAAVAVDGYPPDAAGPQRQRPFNLTQAPGVRLALQVLAGLPMRSAQRRRAVAAGVEAMGDEECLYWYAKARGAEGQRALQALRLLLAGDWQGTASVGAEQ